MFGVLVFVLFPIIHPIFIPSRALVDDLEEALILLKHLCLRPVLVILWVVLCLLKSELRSHVPFALAHNALVPSYVPHSQPLYVQGAGRQEGGPGVVAVGLESRGLLRALLEGAQNAEVSVHGCQSMFNKI